MVWLRKKIIQKFKEKNYVNKLLITHSVHDFFRIIMCKDEVLKMFNIAYEKNLSYSFSLYNTLTEKNSKFILFFKLQRIKFVNSNLYQHQIFIQIWRRINKFPEWLLIFTHMFIGSERSFTALIRKTHRDLEFIFDVSGVSCRSFQRKRIFHSSDFKMSSLE